MPLRFIAVLTFVICTAFSAEVPPNIVMIISDDHHWADYSFAGHPHVKTPNLDKLASESLTFTRGYVPSSLCCPSLATIITGLYPHQHKVVSNDPPEPAGAAKGKGKAKGKRGPNNEAFQKGRERQSEHLRNAGTLPMMLSKLGYMSLQTGKWWQGHFSKGGFTHGMTQGQRHGDQGLDIGRKTMQPIYDFIGEAQTAKKPFMVWYAPMMPHDPHTPPDAILEKYKSLTTSLPVAKYWAMVDWFDQTCGELLKHIDDKGLRDNTIVVYVTDNGWITDPVKGKYAPKSKQSQYDGGVRTPIMIRWPGKAKPQIIATPISSIDIAPTLLKAAGGTPTVAMQGINLLDDAAVSSRNHIFGECFVHSAIDLDNPTPNLRWRYVVEGNHKLILPWKANQPNDVVELYDLKSDPTETLNLAEKKADKVAELTKVIDAWWTP
ncbi:MAG: sulfatase-like hydrolase/transferase [Verrucomicrobiaceae bacterium]|nr:sulfatase-like hydrolase/transferase [Verrucomicrobiaceae bacterium]